MFARLTAPVCRPSSKALVKPAFRMLASRALTAEQVADYHNKGFTVVPNYFTEQEKELLLQWVEEVAKLDEKTGKSQHKWLQHFERLPGGEVRLARTENFVDFHPGFKELTERLRGMVSQAIDGDAVLFKEKINYKYPGGGSFASHQDEPAFMNLVGEGKHCTVGIVVDESSVESGCLEFSPGFFDKLLPQNADGTIADEVDKQFSYQHVPGKCGDMLLFTSYVPHRSGPNRSNHPRRVILLTYNDRNQGGEVHSKYYDYKFEKMRKGMISYIGDFKEQLVEEDTTMYANQSSQPTTRS